MARENRYGLQGDNGYTQMVDSQKPKDYRGTSVGKQENILNFTQKEKSPRSKSVKSDKKSEGSVDLQPVRQQKRSIVNQGAEKLTKKPADTIPGVVNVKGEANRQMQQIRSQEETAAIVMQKWARGWKARKFVSKKRLRMKAQIDYEHAQFTNEFKINDKFNLNKFLSQKQQLRNLNGTDGMDESINEQIIQSMSLDQSESYIKSQIGYSQTGQSGMRSQALQQNFMRPKPTDSDPLSIISIFAKRNAPPPPEDQQMIPDRQSPMRKSRRSRERLSPTKSSSLTRESPMTRPKQAVASKLNQPAAKAKKQSYQARYIAQQMDQEIEEDIDMGGSDYSSEHITESIASFQGPGLHSA
jgi:hypothetical protein